MAGAPRFRRVFTAPADAYDRFMGKFSGPLAPLFCDFAGVAAGQRVLDVGCGPGALVAELVRRVGRGERHGRRSRVAVRRGRARSGIPASTSARRPAEQLPFGDDEFDASLAQLVVHFMTRSRRRPVGDAPRDAGRRCRRGLRLGSRRRRGPLSPFWDAVHALDPERAGRVAARGCAQRPPHRALRRGGLRDVHEIVARGQRPARDVRRVVGAVHVRRRPRRRVPHRRSTPSGSRGSRPLPQRSAPAR